MKIDSRLARELGIASALGGLATLLLFMRPDSVNAHGPVTNAMIRDQLLLNLFVPGWCPGVLVGVLVSGALPDGHALMGQALLVAGIVSVNAAVYAALTLIFRTDVGGRGWRRYAFLAMWIGWVGIATVIGVLGRRS